MKSTYNKKVAKGKFTIEYISGIIVAAFLWFIARNSFKENDVTSGFVFLGLAIYAIFYGYNLGQNKIVGPCPYCGKQINTSIKKASVKCAVCKQRVIIDGNKYTSIN